MTDRSDVSDRPTKKLSPQTSSRYSVTNRREIALDVIVENDDVTITVQETSMTMSKGTARRLVARLLEKLG